MADQDLTGIGVLVTRPKHQSAELVAAITTHGGSVIEWPVLEILPRDVAAIAADEQLLQSPDIAILVSPNAVQHGLAFTAKAQLAAIGPATASAIEAAGCKVAILPAHGYESECLLAQPALQDVANKVVRIVRGDRGREKIAATLRDRGATVEYLPVYARATPTYSDAEVSTLEQRWRSGAIDVVTVMSVESLHNLVALLPDWCRNALGNTPLVTPAARVIQEALDRFPGIPATLAQGLSSNDMLAAISSTKT